MAEALRDALAVALRADPAVFLLGEDLGVPGGFGGGFTVTLGLAEEFGHDRVMDTPISEAAIVGALRVVCPSNPYDAKGLLLAAVRDDNPVLFLEHKQLYGGKGARKEKTSLDLTAEVPAGDYEVPLGTVAVRRAGSDLTILANLLMLHRALAAAAELAREGVEAEVIDVRCLAPLDLEPLQASVRKTGRVLIVEEDNRTGGWGAEVAARLGETAFYDLDAPIQRLGAPDTPLPCAPALERAYVPGVEHVVAAARDLLGY
jgi:pyruvate dehydrogenase E1 component beta subunit